MANDTQIQDLIRQVQSNSKYQSITPSVIRRLAEDALTKGFKGKSAIKYVRNKCHQIGGAYFKKKMDFAGISREIENLPCDLESKDVRQFCVKAMELHSSTAERLPILDSFFETCLAPVAPVTSVLDLACGLNPFSIPWMPLASGFTYTACDIYEDMLGVLQSFFSHFEVNGIAQPCDLTDHIPQAHAQVAFFLKSIPCLEQVDKMISISVLERLQTDHILVSYPVHSLGGRDKGMPDFYREHFSRLISDKSWQIREFLFSSELAFLVSK